VFVAAHLLVLFLVLSQFLTASPVALWGTVLLILALTVFAFVDAGIVAARASRPYELRPYNRWWLYIGLAVAVGFVWNPILRSLLRDSAVQAFRIPSAAMEPTILVGDYLFADKRARARGMPQHNDVIIFNSVTQPGISIIKRVVGLPGDTLVTVAGRLVRNGMVLAEPWTTPLQPSETLPLTVEAGALPEALRFMGANPTLRDWGPIVVPPGNVFVLGDNRRNSWDSRYWGTVPVDRVQGRALSIYLSYDPEAGAVRWERFGTRPWVVQPDINFEPHQ
jgi:signal peptidase I